MKELLKSALSEVFLSFSIQRCQLEAMMKLDFKVGTERAQFMQLCFSSLAAWPLFIVLGLLYLDPTKNDWSLQKIFTEQLELIFWLLDGRLQNMILIFILFFIIQWLFRQEYLFISIVFYFLLKSDLHFHLAISAVAAILLSRSCYLWWLHVDLKSQSRKVWTFFSALQILGVMVGVTLGLVGIDYLQFNRYFSESILVNRAEVLVLMLTLIYFLQFLFSSLWGHFSFKNSKNDFRESKNFPVYYSSAEWILRFKMRPYFKKILKDQTEKYLILHQQNLNELKGIKDLSPVSIPYQITQVLETEISYLKIASSRLTI